jgi:lysophospholipase L1-like esterase
VAARRLDVVNRGFSGYNTRNVLALMDQLFLPASPTTPKMDYLVVLLGANDACIPLPTTSQHVPLDEYRSNLTKIVTHPLVKSHSPKILVVTPPPLDEIRSTELDLQLGHSASTRQGAVSASYSQAARDAVAAAQQEGSNVVLVDLHDALMARAVELTEGDSVDREMLGRPGGQRGGLQALLPDGLHMSGESYRIFFDTLKPHVGPFPKEGTEGFAFPGWREMNPGAI